MVLQSGAAAAEASTLTEAVGNFGKEFGSQFASAAKSNFAQYFKGWKKAGLFCRLMKGLGLSGAIMEQVDIWTDEDKAIWEKILSSGIALILDFIAGKGATTVCFPAGTKVHTQWGLADIEKLEVGVPVLTYNEETGEKEYKKVKKVMRRMTRRMCALELSNGTTLEVTPEHRFFCNGEWTPIEELNVNDTLQLKDNSIVVIENKIIFPTFVEVYNLEIEDNENYYVTEEGVLVHNGYKSRLPRKDGEWTEGVPGDGLWKSNNPDVNKITGGEAIPFKDGRPDFSKWSEGSVKVKGMDGTKSDFSKIYEQLSEDLNLPNKTAAQAWLSENKLTPHHLDSETIQLIPTDLHGNIPHIGSASDMRNLLNK